MIGAFKSCGTGARMLRSTTSGAPGVSSSIESSVLPVRDNNKALNWSQKRFLRQGPPSNGSHFGPGNVNARFVIKEIENQMRMKTKCNVNSGHEAVSLALEKELRQYSRSLRDHQSHLLKSMRLNPNHNSNKVSKNLIAEITKIISEEGSPVVRVKNRRDEAFLKEWICVQNELLVVRRDRAEDYKKRLQIAGQQALREMEENLQKASSLDELDQAIEGALCSEAKREYTQKSWHDN